MTIVQLEYLLAVANYGSFSLASEKCFVTQPSLSTQIKNLEEELGVILLNRNDKPISLTEAGRIVIERSQAALKSFNQIKESVKKLKNDISGELRLAIIPTIAPYLTYKFAPLFLEKYPDVQLTVREMFTRDIITALKKDELDMAILAGGFTDPDEIDEEVLFKDKFYLYTSTRHPLYKGKMVNVEDIDVKKLMLLADGHCLRTQILDLCNAGRNVDNLLFESGSLETLMRLVDATDTMTIIPEMAVHIVSDDKKEQLKDIVNKNATRDISIATSKTFVKKMLYGALRNTVLETV